MPQVKVTLEEKAIGHSLPATPIAFIDNHKKYGYSSRTALVRDAIARLQQQLEQKELEESARIDREIYEEDIELQELTNN